jgi:hypothetical protein
MTTRIRAATPLPYPWHSLRQGLPAESVKTRKISTHAWARALLKGTHVFRPELVRTRDFRLRRLLRWHVRGGRRSRQRGCGRARRRSRRNLARIRRR